MSVNTSFTRKLLEAHITLAEGGFNTATGEAANTKILRLGMDVDIKKPGGEEKNKATVKIFWPYPIHDTKDKLVVPVAVEG